jgi:haloalkane dehalogenase
MMTNNSGRSINNDGDIYRRPEWVEYKLYPFKDRWMEIEGHHIHYIDEGRGSLFLFVHGIPTWSFYYRNMIMNLRDSFRCVALDLPGFGLSKAPKDFEYSLKNESRIFGQFVRALNLSDVTMMAHSIGGPVGLKFAATDPERFSGLVLSGTFAWPIKGIHFLSLMGSPLGAFMVDTNLFIRFFLDKGISLRHLSAEEKLAYSRPFSKLSNRHPTHLLFRSIIKSGDYLSELEQGLKNLRHLPVLLVHGDMDNGVKAGFDSRFQKMFPGSSSVLIKGAAHFATEETPDQVSDAIRSWWIRPNNEIGSNHSSFIQRQGT